MRPHDLLRVADRAWLRYEGSVPAWVNAALDRAPWVVVRRAPTRAGSIPVGVRGRARAERIAAFLAPAAVSERVTPEDLAAARSWCRVSHAHRVDSLRVLNAVEELFAPLGLAWGPTGSVGFELATGLSTARPTSDLDVVVRAPEPWHLEDARELVDQLAKLPVRVDAQLDAPAGAVALTEYAHAEWALLRTPDGPRLTQDPWRDAATDPWTA